MHDENFAVFTEGIAEGFPVMDEFAVDENVDVFAKRSTFVHDVALDAGIVPVDGLQEIGQRFTFNRCIFQLWEKTL